MNQYSSVCRTMRARNVFEGAISPPADLTIASADWLPQILNKRGNLMNINGNFVIRRLGVFANFADGFVFANAAERLNLFLSSQAYTRTVIGGGDLSMTLGSKAVTGTGFAGNIFDQNILAVPYAGTETQYYIVDGNPADDNNLDVTDYAEKDVVAAPLTKLTSLPNYERLDYTRISELNYMWDVNEFISPLAFASVLATDVVITVYVNQNSLNFGDSDITFLTKSISDTYDGDIAHFDVVGDIEYTS